MLVEKGAERSVELGYTIQVLDESAEKVTMIWLVGDFSGSCPFRYGGIYIQRLSLRLCPLC